MTDLDKALAAAREALDTHRVNTSDYCVSVRYIEWAEVVERLIAAIDAARGRVAGESCADHFPGETGYVTFSARVPHGTKLFTAPPAADAALADTQRAIIEAAERRGYERALADLRAYGPEAMLAAPAQQPAAAVLTNPYTGQPRDYRDVESDPAGVLIVEPGAPLKAAPPSAVPEEVQRNAERYLFCRNGGGESGWPSIAAEMENGRVEWVTGEHADEAIDRALLAAALAATKEQPR